MTILFFAKVVAAVFGLFALLMALAVFAIAMFGKVPPKQSRYEYEDQNNQHEFI